MKELDRWKERKERDRERDGSGDGKTENRGTMEESTGNVADDGEIQKMKEVVGEIEGWRKIDGEREG